MRGLTDVLEEAEQAVTGFRNAFVDKYGNVTESAVSGTATVRQDHSDRSRTNKSAHVSREYERSSTQRNARSELNHRAPAA